MDKLGKTNVRNLTINKMEETYRKVFIKTEADLPKKSGYYLVYFSDENEIGQFFFEVDKTTNITEDHDYWLENIGWYFEPLENDQPVTAKTEQEKRPEIVCICGSGRFLKQMHEVEERLTLEGKIVLMIGVNDVARTANLEHYKPMLDELHLRKIDLSDKVFIVNVGGYIGESTRREITYSENHGKPIEYLERETIGKSHFDIEGGGGVTVNEIEQEKPSEQSAEKKTRAEILLKYTPYLGSADITYANILKAMEEYAQERTKDMYPKEFVEWLQEDNWDKYKKLDWWVKKDRKIPPKNPPLTLDELFTYWKERVRK